jgi:hypothetical protein
MNRPSKIILNTCYIIILVSVSFLATYFIYSPIHETIHSAVCLINGLQPVQERFATECKGIENASYLAQFFFFMAPYIFSVALLLIIKFTYNKLRFVKYLIFIPVMDVLVNYVLSKNLSQFTDFTWLLVNTNEILFVVSMGIVLIALFLAIDLIWKTKILSSNSIT